MKAIFKREVKSYFTGMIGWVVAAVSLFFLGLYYTNRNLLYASSDFASVLYTMTMILLFLLPAISMRSFAEERKNRTDQLLLTSPVSIPAIVAGKFLAEVAVFALPLAAAVLMPLILKAFGTVSLVAAYSAVLGYLLLGSACLAVGTWISALTENQILAYLATFGWSVNAEPKEVQKIRIPESSDNKVFARYNELQRSQGFDLTGFGGKEAMRYVYEILNYPNAAAPVYASVIVYDGHIIGGDITNSAPEGKIHGFKMPGTAPETSSESLSESSSGASGESTEPSEPSESTAPETTEPTVSSAS